MERDGKVPGTFKACNRRTCNGWTFKNRYWTPLIREGPVFIECGQQFSLGVGGWEAMPL